jgi:hypothetical protein
MGHRIALVGTEGRVDGWPATSDCPRAQPAPSRPVRRTDQAGRRHDNRLVTYLELCNSPYAMALLEEPRSLSCAARKHTHERIDRGDREQGNRDQRGSRLSIDEKLVIPLRNIALGVIRLCAVFLPACANARDMQRLS